MAEGVTYDSITGFNATPTTMSSLVQSGVMVPDGTSITSTTEVTFNSTTTLTLASDTTITIPEGTVFTAGTSTTFATLAASTTVGVGDLTNIISLGALSFGLPDLDLTVSPAVTINIYVGNDYNGRTLSVYRKDATGSWKAGTGSSGNGTDARCTVDSGICSFETTHLSDFSTGKVQLTIATPTLTTSKNYDANTSATVTAGALSGVVSPDVVTVSAVATYDNTNAGTNKTITVVYTLAGADAANYIKPVNYTVATGAITSSSGGGWGGAPQQVFQTPVVSPVVSTAVSSVVSAGFSFKKDLELGSKGADVTELQKVLVAGGYLVMPQGVAYGYFGSVTKTAVMKYQKAKGLTPVAGYVGAKTRAVLNASVVSTVQTTVTTVTTVHSFVADLELGSKGDAVTALQHILIDGGYMSSGYPFGYFGSVTKTAVMKYQKAKGITPVAGYVGAKTRAVLNASN